MITEVQVDKSQKKKSVANTLAGTKNDTEKYTEKTILKKRKYKHVSYLSGKRKNGDKICYLIPYLWIDWAPCIEKFH